MYLTSVEKVKTLLEISESNADLDALIEDSIASVSAQAGLYCNRNFSQQEYVEYHDGGVSKLFLSNPPVIEVYGVWVDPDHEWGSEDEIPSDHYFLVNANIGILMYNFGYFSYPPCTPGEIRVLYMGGYREGEVPEDLEMAVRKQVVYQVRRRQDIGLASVSFPDGSIQKREISEFLPDVKAILDRYFLRTIG